MKVSDIPQLTHVNSPVSWQIDDIQYTLDRYQKTYGLNLDPEFQRGHVWNEQTQIKFVEFVLRGGVTQPIRFNSPIFGGHTKAKNSDLPNDVVIVDGKQRLTAVMKFVDNKLPVFSGNYLNDFDDPARALRGAELTYQVNKLQTKAELYTWYLEMNEGQVAHSKEELDKVRNLLAKVK